MAPQFDPKNVYGRLPTEAELATARTLWDYHNLAEHMRPELETDSTSPDIILALGSNERAVIERAVELYRRFPGVKLVCSGSNRPDNLGGKSEAEAFGEIAQNLGVPETDIILETAAKDTPSNIVKSREVLAAAGIDPQKIILVAAPQHTRRVMLTAQAKWPGKEYRVAAPIQTFEEFMAVEPRLQTGRIKSLVGQTLRLSVYGGNHKGDIAEEYIPEEVVAATRELEEVGYVPIGDNKQVNDLVELVKKHGIDERLQSLIDDLEDLLSKSEEGQPAEEDEPGLPKS